MKKLSFTLVSVILLFGLSVQNTEITILNHKNGDTLPYQLAIVKGECRADVSKISMKLNGKSLKFPVRENRFNSICAAQKRHQ